MKSNSPTLPRFLVSAVLVFASLFAVVAPAGAWGFINRTETWGCAWHGMSANTSPKYSETIKNSSHSCSSMYARLRTSSGGGGSWATDPDWAMVTSHNTAYAGGDHRVCGGCAVHKT